MLFSNLHSLIFASKLPNIGLCENEEHKQDLTLTFKENEAILLLQSYNCFKY